MHYYEVLTATKNKTNKLLTYAAASKLRSYQIVEVPLRRQTCLGLVVKQTDPAELNDELRDKCREIKARSPYRLPAKLVRSVLGLGRQSALSLSAAAQLLLSNALLKASGESWSGDTPPAGDALQPPLNAAQQRVYRAINAGQAGIPQLILGINGSGKTRIYAELIKDQLRVGRSALVLVPEIGLSAQVLELLRDYLPFEIDHFHSGLRPKQRRELWEKCLTGSKPTIVVGPRSAEFLPFKNLGLIVMDECHDDSFKQERQPSYHSLQLASILAKNHKAKIVCGSATPRVEDYYRFRRAGYPVHNLRTGALPNRRPPRLTVVDKRELKRNFSRPALDGIVKALRDGRQALVFYNRRGHWRVAKCYQCLWQAECPSCLRSLIFHRDKFKLICHGCGHAALPISACPECKQAITYSYAGVKSVTEELEQRLAEINLHPPVWRFDSDNLKRDSLAVKLKQIKQRQSLVILGTQVISQGLDLPNLQTVVILDAGQSLVSPDYRSHEKFYRHIHQLAGRVGRGHLAETELVIQTDQPEDPVLRHALKHDWLAFYEEEIAGRRKYLLPPFAHFANISVRRGSQAATRKAAEQLHEELAPRFKAVKLYRPAPALREKHPKYWEWLIHASCPTRRPLLEMADFFKDKEHFFNLDPGQLFAGEN
ncbi:primosomal protein N' [Candidatus Saccharibacteria bacterium]|nr:primosomal protein N' [Candidatus Saccharibacteria bacterium]